MSGVDKNNEYLREGLFKIKSKLAVQGEDVEEGEYVVHGRREEQVSPAYRYSAC